MQHAANILCMVSAEDIQRILMRVPIMDDQRFAQLARQLDMSDKERLLLFGRCLLYTS